MLEHVVERFSRLRVTVIGDALLDTFVECTPRKLCSEGPVPVVWKHGELTVPGGAANVAANLASLGARVCLVAAAGRDPAGQRLRERLHELDVDLRWLLEEPGFRTHHKTRILADRHYVVRVDEGETPLPAQQLALAACEAVEGADAVVLSDYDLGVLSDESAERLAAVASGRPLVVDSKRLARFRSLGPTAVTPNLEESIELAGGPGPSDWLATRVRALTEAELVAVTLGPGGVHLLDATGEGRQLPARPVRAESTVGAGDSFVAAFALALAADASPHQAGVIAVEASGIAVSKRHTAVVDAGELARSLAFVRAPEPAADPSAELAYALERRRRQGQRVVFTNGVFDLLHPGHVDFLGQARRLGDCLVVAVNSDASARRLKGPDRPVLHEDERRQLLAALDCVDHVVLFDDDTAVDLLRRIRPDVYVKGADYVEAAIPEAETARQVGSRIEILPRRVTASTTSLIRRVHRSTSSWPPSTS